MLRLPPASESGGGALGELVRVCCSLLADLASGSAANQAMLLQAVPRLARHARCVEAVEAIDAIFRHNRPNCEGCPPTTVRALALLPLRHRASVGDGAHRRRLLALLRRLVAPHGAPVRRAQELLLAALLELPPALRAQLLPLSIEPPAVDARAVAMAAGAATSDDRYEYELLAIELLADVASGPFFGAEALCRRLYPLPALAAAIADERSTDALRAPLLRLFTAAYVNVEVSVPGLLESDALQTILVFLERRGAAMARVIVMGNAEASVLSKYELTSMAEAPLALVDDIVAAVEEAAAAASPPPDANAPAAPPADAAAAASFWEVAVIPALTTLLRYIYRAADAPPPTREAAARLAAAAHALHSAEAARDADSVSAGAPRLLQLMRRRRLLSDGAVPPSRATDAAGVAAPSPPPSPRLGGSYGVPWRPSGTALCSAAGVPSLPSCSGTRLWRNASQLTSFASSRPPPAPPRPRFRRRRRRRRRRRGAAGGGERITASADCSRRRRARGGACAAECGAGRLGRRRVG